MVKVNARISDKLRSRINFGIMEIHVIKTAFEERAELSCRAFFVMNADVRQKWLDFLFHSVVMTEE